MTTKRRKKTPIDVMLSRAQNLQTSCFGIPIGVTIEASKGTYNTKMLTITIHCEDTENNAIEKSCTIYSSSKIEDITQAWGTVKDFADKLLDELVGHRITAKGNLKQLTQLAP